MADLHCASLRPALLRSLLAQLPLAAACAPSAAASLMAALEAHQLLAEAEGDGDASRAVHAFGERLSALAGSQWEESRLAAATLLAALYADAQPARFAACAEAWTAPLPALLQPAECARVRCAAAAAASAALARAAALLAAYPQLRREASALLGKALNCLLPQLGEGEGPPALRLASLRLLCAAAGGPAAGALRAHLPAAERLAAGSLHGPGRAVREAAAEALARLPRAQGDAAAWSAHARRLLLSAHGTLDEALRGCEPPGAAARARGGLEAPGEAEAAPFAAPPAGAAPHERALDWMAVLARLLHTPYPAPVPFPAAALLRLVGRVMAADGAAVPPAPGAPPLPPPPAALLQLPALHAGALELLAAALGGGGRGAWIPCSAPLAALLAAALRAGVAAPPPGGGPPAPTCAALRTAAYAAAGRYLTLLGSSFSLRLAPHLLAAARADLALPRAVPLGAAPPAGGGGKKRKKGEAEAAPPAAANAAAAAPAAGGVAARAACAARTAALGALACLLDSAGGVLEEPLRADLDFLVAAAAEAAWAEAAGGCEARAGDEACAEREAALRCLMASLLAPRPCRPPHLHLALALLRRGAARADSAAACAAAMASLEALLHPVAAPQPQPRLVSTPSLVLAAAAAAEAAAQAAAAAPREAAAAAAAQPQPPAVQAQAVPPMQRAQPRPPQPAGAYAAPPPQPAPAPAAPPTGAGWAPLPGGEAIQPLQAGAGAAAAARPPVPPIGDSDSDGPMPEIVDGEDGGWE